jgi:hypothetical protein
MEGRVAAFFAVHMRQQDGITGNIFASGMMVYSFEVDLVLLVLHNIAPLL